jgi:hypothetical protein
MKFVKTLICYGLRQILGMAGEQAVKSVADIAGRTIDPSGVLNVLGTATDQAVEFVVQRFTDESQALPKAIAAANERTWKALGVGLAGDGLWDEWH